MSPEEDWHSIYTEDWLVQTEKDRETEREKENYITKKVKCVQFLVVIWIMGIHYGQVLHKEPEQFNNFKLNQ